MTKWTRQNKDGEFQTLDDREDSLWDFFIWWLLDPERKRNKNRGKKSSKKKSSKKKPSENRNIYIRPINWWLFTFLFFVAFPFAFIYLFYKKYFETQYYEKRGYKYGKV